MTRHLFRSLLSLSVLLVFVSSASAQTVESVIEKCLAAAGGRQALEKITTRRSTGTVTLSTPGGNVGGTFEILLKAPNKSRYSMTLDVSAAGGSTVTIDQRFDGTAGVTINSAQGMTEMTGNQLENARNNVFPSPL